MRSRVVPLENVPITVKGLVSPTGMVTSVLGLKAMEVKVGSSATILRVAV